MCVMFFIRSANLRKSNILNWDELSFWILSRYHFRRLLFGAASVSLLSKLASIYFNTIRRRLCLISRLFSPLFSTFYSNYVSFILLWLYVFLGRLTRDRRFTAFSQPVDPDDVPDYYTHIKNPMDLNTMFLKASTYKTPEEFLNDFRLIHRNAIEYNPITDCEGIVLVEIVCSVSFPVFMIFLRKVELWSTYFLMCVFLCCAVG